MASNFDLSDLYCVFGTDKHYYQAPVQISCSHFVCKECIPIGTELMCNKCNMKNENDLKKASEQASFRAKTLLSLHFNELCDDLIDRFNEKILLLENSVEIVNAKLENDSQISKIKVKERITKIKNELENLEGSLIEQLDFYQFDLKDQLDEVYKVEIILQKNNLEKVKSDIENHNISENQFYEFQKIFMQFNRKVKKFEEMNHSLSFEGESLLSSEFVGTISCNFNGFEGRLKRGDFHVVQLEESPIDVCELPNGNLLVAIDNNTLKIYDKNFAISNVKTIDKKPNSLATNFEDTIFIHCTDNSILMMDLELNMIQTMFLNENEDLSFVRNYIYFHNHLIYICEKNENFITRLSYKNGLKLHSRFYFDSSPNQIQIIDNVACVSFSDSLEREYLNFYEITSFQLLESYSYPKTLFAKSAKDGKLRFRDNKVEILSICAQDKIFFVLFKCGKKIDCYNKNGKKGETINLHANKTSNTKSFLKTYQKNFMLMHVFENDLFVYKI